MTKSKQKNRLPVKKSFAIIATIVWATLFLKDYIPYFLDGSKGNPFGTGVIAAVGLLFLSALLSFISPSFRRLIVKEGHDQNDIKKPAIFLMILSVLLLLAIVFAGKVIFQK